MFPIGGFPRQRPQVLRPTVDIIIRIQLCHIGLRVEVPLRRRLLSLEIPVVQEEKGSHAQPFDVYDDVKAHLASELALDFEVAIIDLIYDETTQVGEREKGEAYDLRDLFAPVPVVCDTEDLSVLRDTHLSLDEQPNRQEEQDKKLAKECISNDVAYELVQLLCKQMPTVLLYDCTYDR